MKTKPIYKSAAGRAQIMALYDKVLSQWPVPCEHVNIPTRYGNTFAIASGQAGSPPMILLHGTASNSATWAHDVIDYSKSFRVWCVDIPGEPGKSDEARFGWNGPHFSEWLDDVLNGLNLEKAVMGGMSLGGWATLKYATVNPHRVEKLVLISPSGVCPARLSVVFRLIAFSLLGKWGFNRMKRLVFGDVELTEEAEEFFVLTSRYFNFRPGSPPLFTDSELQRLNMPVLYLAGKSDALLQSQESADRLRELVPNLSVILVEEGHAVINMAPRILWLLGDNAT